MLETLHSLTLLTVVEIVGPTLLLAVLIYAAVRAGRRRKLGAARNAIRDERTEALYERTDDGRSHADALSARHSGERMTEDDMTRAELGPRGVPGQPDPARMTPQRAKKTPKHLEPGHTA